MKSVEEFNFDVMIKAAVERRRLIPAIAAFLNNPDFESFQVQVEGWKEGKRRHDGWWHPSTHGNWDERKLFLYLAYPDQVLEEQMPSEGIKAVTAGKFWHDFYQNIFLAMGLLVPHDNPPWMNPAERPLSDPKLRIKGHTDGKLYDQGEFIDELLEIKSINEFQVDKVISEDILREKKPDYYAQTQDYLMMEFGPGRGVMRYFLVHPSYPFKEVEFTVKANERFQLKRAAVYAEVWEAVQAHQRDEDVALAPPCPGCRRGTKMAQTCAVRRPCPRGEEL